MRTKAAFLVGSAVGYVLGTRAGRQQFEKIKTQAQKVWENPKVQESVSGVSEKATGFVKEKAPELKDKLTGGSSSGATSPSPDTPDELGTFTTAGTDETENGRPGSTGTSYPTGGSI
ncbi:YtxH domain-containing protein [Cellulomonas carbonis]|uniref:YtxH domain-containing protein n=1 Tax=Cellulomonas carbonis T26 TaxID=947969 RepID=A0A0A0BQ94_9CELL|nr:YtxH domain-containing protein [Cellulomonas carbonis]KGM10653.1 hypothetical protein N868_14245 [Cellulomonas carbonis T26]GGB92256.1 hypothetical protein GCM10010972_01160 [Cellulomonas carbonis]